MSCAEGRKTHQNLCECLSRELVRFWGNLIPIDYLNHYWLIDCFILKRVGEKGKWRRISKKSEKDEQNVARMQLSRITMGKKRENLVSIILGVNEKEGRRAPETWKERRERQEFWTETKMQPRKAIWKKRVERGREAQILKTKNETEGGIVWVGWVKGYVLGDDGQVCVAWV